MLTTSCSRKRRAPSSAFLSNVENAEECWPDRYGDIENAFGEAGYEPWRSWSEADLIDLCNNYDEADCERVWRSFGKYPEEKQVALATAFWLARKHGYPGPKKKFAFHDLTVVSLAGTRHSTTR